MSDHPKDDPLRPSETPEGVPGALGTSAPATVAVDTSRWHRALVEGKHRAIGDEMSQVAASEGPQAVTPYLASRIAQLTSDPKIEAQVTCFVAIINQLAWHERHGGLQPADIGRIAEMGDAILKTSGIAVGASKLAFLHADLQQALALIRRKEGRSFEAAWLTQVALSMGRRDTATAGGHAALASALRAGRRGDAQLALEGFALAESQGLTPALLETSRLARLQTLRLSGDLSRANQLANDTLSKIDLSDEGAREFQWEELCRAAQASGDLSPLVAAVSRGRSHRNSTYLLEASLWVKTVSSKQWLTRVPKAESIRRLTPESLKKPAHNAWFYECCLQMDRCYDQAIPLSLRVKALGQTLSQAGKLLTLDKELLLWAAAARWLVRHHQHMFAAIAMGEYKSLCLRLSNGAQVDTLALMLDWRDSAWLRFTDQGRMGQYDGKEPIKKLSSSTVARAAGVTRLTMGIASSKIKTSIKRLTASPEEIASFLTAEQEDMAAQLLRTIGTLKGPLLKTAQLINYVSPDLPPAIREALSQMQDSTPPFDTGVLKNAFLTEFGRSTDAAFTAFDEAPLAAASIGQIHRAETHDGRSVVVKLQYPGIEEAIRNDLKWSRLLNFIYRRNFPSVDVEAITDESESNFLEECDFRREADLQTRIRANFAGDPQVVVPYVVPELSGRRTLTMEYIAGQKFSEFVITASQAEKQAAAETIYRFAMTSFLRHGTFNADPHPGNYLFLGDGRVAFLDFGFAADYHSRERLQLWRDTFRALMTDDHANIFPQLIALGFVVGPERFNMDEARTRAHQLSRPFCEAPFKFGHGHLKGIVRSTTITGENKKYLHFPREDFRLLRFLWCLHMIMADLEAEGNWGAMVEGIIMDAEKSPDGSPTRSALRMTA